MFPLIQTFLEVDVLNLFFELKALAFDEDEAFEVLSAASLLLRVGTASVNDLVDRFDDGHFFGGFVIDLLLIEHAFEIEKHASDEEGRGGDEKTATCRCG